MQTRKAIREFQQQKLCLKCSKGHSSWLTFAEIMSADKFHCCQCGERLSFDKEEWRAQHFKPPSKSIDEKISERGKSKPRGEVDE